MNSQEPNGVMTASAHVDSATKPSLLQRIAHRKLVHWLAAYGAAAYTLLHGVEMIVGGFGWPHMVVTITTAVVLLGAPVAALIAWFHGERGLQRVSGMELAIFTLMGIVAGSVLWMVASSGVGHGSAVSASVQGVSAAEVTAPVSAPVAAPPRSAVAVLPFDNQTGDDAKEYMGDGIATELISTLNRVKGLKVPARTSSFAYKGRATNIRQIARDLGVGSIVEGSVRALGRRVRVDATLINAADGLTLWSRSYDEEFLDLFKLQERLATEIVRELQPSLNVAAAAISQAPPTKDVEAYALFLQGQSLMERTTAESLARSQSFYQQAIDRDPQFARAYSGLADYHLSKAVFANEAVIANLAAAERNARRALALDPLLANAHSELAGLGQFRRQFIEMEVHDLAALSLAADNGWSHSVRGLHLAVVGRMKAALEEVRIAYALAPADARIVSNLAMISAFAGLNVEAKQVADKAIGLGLPNNTLRIAKSFAILALRESAFAEAARLEIATLNTNDAEQAKTAEVFKLVYGALSSPAQRPQAIAARVRLYPRQSASDAVGRRGDIGPCLQSAFSYALINAIDDAYSLANQCLDEAAAGAADAATDKNTLWIAELRAFRKDPRFQPFVARQGMMEYWQLYGAPDECDLTSGKLICR
jgi:TolB-like protein